MKKTKKLVALLFVAVLAFSLLAGCGKDDEGAADPQGEQTVIARVNGEEIYQNVYEDWFMQTMALSLGLDISTPLDDSIQQYIDGYKLSYLNSYAEQMALIQNAKENEVVVEDSEIEEYIDQLKSVYGSDEAFQQFQTMAGFTDTSIRDYIRMQMNIQHLYELKTADITEPSHDPEEYYNSNPGKFKVEENRTVRHILVEDEAEAKEIIASLNDGADFNELVQEKSTDTGSVANNGTIGPFTLADNYVTEFKEAAFALGNVGDVTQEPVKTTYGYHIIILDNISPATTQTFEEVKDSLTAELILDAKDLAFEDYANGVIEAADIQFEEGWDPYEAYNEAPEGDGADEGAADPGSADEGAGGAGQDDAGQDDAADNQ